MDSLEQILHQRAASRRTFLTGAGSLAATAALAGCTSTGKNLVPAPSPAPAIVPYNDNDILNFALNLEYLEAEFYLRAATGNGLAAADTGNATTTVTVPSATKVTAPTSFTQNLLNELAYTEQQHVRFLRSALGPAAIGRPAIDFVNSFNTIGSLAGIGNFNPFQSFDAFVTAAALFEDLGVTAYNGAVTLISAAGAKSGILAAAAGIMSVEAYHGATLRAYLTNQAITKGTTAYPYFGYFNTIQAKVISPLSTSYGTLNLTAAGANPSTSVPSTIVASSVVPADSNALAFHRTTDEVLHVVYGSLSTTSGGLISTPGVKSGGFFPSGLNGSITVTQS